jgi:hypothetical protein
MLRIGMFHNILSIILSNFRLLHYVLISIVLASNKLCELLWFHTICSMVITKFGSPLACMLKAV